MYFTPITFIKTVAASATPEQLGANSLRLTSIQFIAEKAFGENNSDDITIQIKQTDGTFTDAKTIEPGLIYTWLIPSASEFGFYRASDFKIKVATNGDGVRIIASQPTGTPL